jgi:transposase
MKAQPHDPADQAMLFLLWNQERDAKQKDRYRVALLAVVGFLDPAEELEREEIVELTGRSRQFVDEWIGRYRRGGVNALKPIRQPGRVPKLNVHEKETLRQILDEGPQEGVDPRSVFFGDDIRKLIERRFGKLYTLSGTYKLLHQMEYSWLCPRPHHPKGDPAAQEAFKKRSSMTSTKSEPSIPANAS